MGLTGFVLDSSAKTPEASQRRREYIEELVSLVPVYPATNKTAWLVGQIEGQEAPKEMWCRSTI